VQHADEGTLHSYLDGELTPAEVMELERHLSVCAPCRAKFTEAKRFLGVADELIPLLDTVPAGTRSPATAPKGKRPWPIRPAALAWAASIVLAAGVGYAWRAQPVMPAPAAVAPQLSDVATDAAPAAAPAQPHDPQVAVRPRATPRREATADAAREAPAPTALAAAEISPPAAPAPAPLRQEESTGGAGAVSSTMGLSAKSTDAARANDNVALVEGVPVDTTAAGQRQRFAFGPGTTADPKRITLDQAVDLLGGSIQLIDGLTPQRVELLAGVDVPGADPNRQVVRVYYEEPDLGLVTLDQQRPAPSYESRRVESSSALPPVTVLPSAPAAASPLRRDIASLNTISWRADGVWLSLTTRLPPERTAQLQARVK
jgi:hypothetical protein